MGSSNIKHPAMGDPSFMEAPPQKKETKTWQPNHEPGGIQSHELVDDQAAMAAIVDCTHPCFFQQSTILGGSSHFVSGLPQI